MTWNPVILATLVGLAPPAAAGVDYGREVKPILAARCTSCHGAIRQKAGLRLDTAELMKRGGDGGPAVEPGKSGESPLVERVTAADPSERMPPKSEGVPLSAAEVATLRAWIDQGAQAPPEPTPPDPRSHWAYRPPSRPPVPRPADPAWAANPIDAFLAAAHEARGLKPSPPAPKDLWLRRVTLDLIGLPPTRAELHAFRAADGPDAADRVVDRLLADPRHGERWGRHWMDVWRYSDWYGLGAEARYSHPHIWHWRDWIVQSLNADTGYDRMVVAMLAGDEAAPDDADTVRATGFLARNWDIFNRNVWLASTVEHTARAFLGVTIQCARCHDHKFDPVSQVEYYRLRAFFEPYHLRVDRVPGEPDRSKAGIPRAFDDFVTTPTYRFIRGDEARPDKARPLRPGTPAVLGGEAKVTPVPLPLGASCPDKRPFVVRELQDAAAKEAARTAGAAAAARRKSEEAEKALAAATEADTKAEARLAAAANRPDDLKPARSTAAEAVEGLARARRLADDARDDRAVAEALRDAAGAEVVALNAVLEAERLEDDGAKAAGSASWAEAARQAAAAQRALALARSGHERLAARRDLARARRSLDGLLAAPVEKGDPLKGARATAAAAVVEARGKVAAAEVKRAAAEKAAKSPLTTAYTPRALEFPRAKTTYRDVPPTNPYPKTSTGRRLALARWIVARDNPLAARVAVNHVWARHFGEPLVDPTYDFGLRAPRPALHELLDWLAVELIESGWSMKHLHRLVVTSRAYRMASSGGGPGDRNAALDPDNRLLWRMNPRRMEGEVVRDSVLFLSGRLDPRMGGPDLPVADAESGTRRTVYYRYASGDRIQLLSMFDAPSVEECYRRHETIVPQQALALTNSGMVLSRAAEIAAAVDREVGAEPATRGAFVASAFERIIGRPPTGAERSECLAGLDRLGASFAAGAGPGAPESRARAALVHVLLNHNDFVTVR